MQYLTKLIFAASLAGALFTPNATSQDNDARQLSFDSIIKTEDKGTSVLVIPMNGQMSTDISIDAYKPLLTKIKDLNPDLIIFEMFCQDFKTDYYEIQRRGDQSERNGYDPDGVKDLVRFFRITLKDIPQIMWIQDSCGGSSVLTFGWPSIYMSDKAKLQGTTFLARNWNYIDRNKPTWGKMYQAWTAHAKNVAEIGGRSIPLIMTFVDPDATVSGIYDGRNVIWEKGTEGYLVADSGRLPPKINADEAEQFAISKGTVRDHHDIMISEGIREYHLVGEDLTKSIQDYKINWRKTYEKTSDLWKDSQQFAQWATGVDTERFLREQLKAVEQVLRLIKRWDAVEYRMSREHRVNKDNLTQLIKQLEERLRALRDAEDSGTRRGGGGLAGSSGGGGAR